MTQPESTPQRPRLHALGGKEAPAKLLAEIAMLLALPAAAKQDLWSALGPALGEPVPPAAEGAITAFVTRHNVSGRPLSLALKACRYLLRQAAQLNIDAQRFSADLMALDEGRGELERILMSGYEVAKATVRAEAASMAVLQHGRVLLDADWRVDLIAATSKARGLHAPIVMLTLRYFEEGRQQTMTFQAPSDVLRKLQTICAELLE
jgi:hypothetical protein